MNDKILIIQTIHLLESKHPRDCKICSVIECPFHSPYHLNKQGCPVCKPALSYVCLECQRNTIDLANGIELCNTCLNKYKKRLKRFDKGA